MTATTRSPAGRLLLGALLFSTAAPTSAAEVAIYSSTDQATTAGFSTALTPEENSKTCLAGKGTAVQPDVLLAAATKWHSGGLYCELSRSAYHSSILMCISLTFPEFRIITLPSAHK